jgi:DNA-binding NarL/FixJ family response regulator
MDAPNFSRLGGGTVKNERVLVISTYPLFIEAITQVLQAEGIEVVATANNLAIGLPLLKKYQLDTIIMACDQVSWQESYLLWLLAGHEKDYQIIFLTLADNHMIIHQWQHVKDATPADLVSIVCAGGR